MGHWGGKNRSSCHPWFLKNVFYGRIHQSIRARLRTRGREGYLRGARSALNGARRMKVYLDHHATTPTAPGVASAMMPFLVESFGNAGSRHYLGERSRKAVEDARMRVASLVGARPAEVVFTSGATEANNLAILGLSRARGGSLGRIITTAYEHPSVEMALAELERQGWVVTTLKPDADGQVSAAAVAVALEDGADLVSVVLANNEIGAINDLKEIVRVSREKGALVHTDAAQAVGTVPLNVRELGVDLLTASAHKFHGPKGIGFLYLRAGRPRVKLEPVFFGGGQERGLRSGTLPTHQVVGCGAAAQAAIGFLAGQGHLQVAALRDRLLKKLREGQPDLLVNGALSNRLPQNLNCCFPGVDNQALLMMLKDEVCFSTAAACSSSGMQRSKTLEALELSPERIDGSIRLGLSRFTTEAEVDWAAAAISRAVGLLRQLSA